MRVRRRQPSLVRRAPKKVLAALRRELQPAELFGIEELPPYGPSILAQPKCLHRGEPPFRVPKKYRRTFWDRGAAALRSKHFGAAEMLAQRRAATWLRGQDSNLRPSGYEPDELPNCSTPRYRHPQRCYVILPQVQKFVNCFCGRMKVFLCSFCRGGGASAKKRGFARRGRGAARARNKKYLTADAFLFYNR